MGQSAKDECFHERTQINKLFSERMKIWGEAMVVRREPGVDTSPLSSKRVEITAQRQALLFHFHQVQIRIFGEIKILQASNDRRNELL